MAWPHSFMRTASRRETSATPGTSDALGARIEPEIPEAYRPGEMRALTPDISRAAAAGFQPAVTLEDGLARYVQWLREQGPVAERFGKSLDRLRTRRMVHEVAS